MTGAELYPGATIPGGVTYLKLAQETYDEAQSQWDSKCGGGIYWSRIRQAPTGACYKSSIKSVPLLVTPCSTNMQQLLLGARLYIATKNQTYLDNANTMYTWLKVCRHM